MLDYTFTDITVLHLIFGLPLDYRYANKIYGEHLVYGRKL